jgi:hypothetical protein
MGGIDLEIGENVFSDIEFPVSFSVSDGKVTVYAFDSGGGYYFADHAAPNEKIYTRFWLRTFPLYGYELVTALCDRL